MGLRTDMLIKSTTGELVSLRAQNALLALQLEAARRSASAWKQAAKRHRLLHHSYREHRTRWFGRAYKYLVERNEVGEKLESARRAACAWKQAAKDWREEALSLSAEIEVRNDMELELEEQEIRS